MGHVLGSSCEVVNGRRENKFADLLSGTLSHARSLEEEARWLESG